MKVLISIVNYNTRDLTSNCINSILSKKWKNDVEIWLVDNASTDGSFEMIRREFPNVKLIKNSSNTGFGAGHNLVLKENEGDYYLVLNSDCKLEDNVIDEMVKFMEKNSDCGISSCKILGFDGKLQPNSGDLPFGWALFSWLFNLDFFGGKSFHRIDPLYYEKAHEVGWVSGSFMMIKDKVIKKVGLFNENYFMYFEDVEYCFRAKNKGFNIMINPEVKIKHLSGGSLDNPRFSQWLGEYRGLIRFYKEHYDLLTSLFINAVCYFSIFLRIFTFALLGKFKISLTYGKIVTSI